MVVTTDRSEARTTAERQRARRADLSQEEKEAERELNRHHQRQHRARLTQGELARDLENRTLQSRVEVTPERWDAGTDIRSVERQAREEAESEAAKEAIRNRRKSVRRGHALAHHESFVKSRVSGKNVVDGLHVLPPMYECILCGAWKWPGESIISCCLGGEVRLPPLQRVPHYLLEYYKDADFRKYIRAYNQVFAFTSVGVARNGGGVQRVREDTSVQGQRGVYTFRIQGAMGHYLGSLLPRQEFDGVDFTPAKFAQIYIVDEDMKQRSLRRKGIFADLDEERLMTLENMMETYNPFAQQFLSHAKKIRKDIEEGNHTNVNVIYQLHADRIRPRTTNLPTVNEVGAVMIDDGTFNKQRDILLYTKRNSLLRIFETNPMYDPLQYPLLFPHGELGYTYTDKYANGQKHRNKEKMSLREHIAYRLFPKMDDGSVLHQGGRLFQQWCVDQRAKVEQEILRWVSNNQKTLRADLYTGVKDAYRNEEPTTLREVNGLLSEYNRTTHTLVNFGESSENTTHTSVNPDDSSDQVLHFLKRIGKRVVLPGSFTGGPRQMYMSYQDSMAVVREFGKPDIFLTMTCNPEWGEIVGQLPEGQKAPDRPDIVARVWNLKLREVLLDIDEGVLGRILARIYVVEFQKRGLPHAHILIILAEEDKPRARAIIDKLVSAKIPDEVSNPELYKTVMTCMMHGPCGNLDPNCACMKDGSCSKGFPKPLVAVTRANPNGYAEYMRRRRSPGVLNFRGREYENETANQWVVPYNPYFSQKYNCHINVEVCTGITAVKYIYKYIHKGSDKTVLTIEAVRRDPRAVGNEREEPNEVLRYLNARYLSPIEACIRNLEYPLQGKTHSVQLTVHLEGKQVIVFNSDEDPGSPG
ncbi:unnamed protein product [Phytophthora fragariaefolia]|uniref:Unnamed protein product n=1 Tax=Phytophthora fragariaefolia TaxID=1490495 RepID=A0A9W6XSV9_9STRA|nr:unnamed protein product [Phytophthora fragariaefolia]